MNIEEMHIHMEKKEWTLVHALAVFMATAMEAENLIPKGISGEQVMDACVASAERSFALLQNAKTDDDIPDVDAFVMTTAAFAVGIMRDHVQVVRIESDDSDA